MPRHGGEAAQRGFRYQDLWTVDAALDLIDGDASGLEVEPLGDEDTGIDFIVTRPPGVREHHTVKRRHRKGHWTLSRLAEEGPPHRSILHDLVAKTQAGDYGVLCSGTSASDFKWLIEHAQASTSWPEFERRIRSNDRVSGDFYKHVVPACGTKEAAHAALRRLDVEVRGRAKTDSRRRAAYPHNVPARDVDSHRRTSGPAAHCRFCCPESGSAPHRRVDLRGSGDAWLRALAAHGRHVSQSPTA